MQQKYSLKVMWLNAHNLFLLSDQTLTAEHLKLDEIQWQKLSTSIFENKPLSKTKELAKIILSEKPDIVSLCEVGGLESLQNFNTLFLGDQYSAALVEGNSDRNIDLGFLVRKGLPFYFDLRSNKNRPLQFLYTHERKDPLIANIGKDGKSNSHKFSRDLVELHLFNRDREKPFLILLAVHLKSRLDPEMIDPNGQERRRAELNTTIQIYNELQNRYGHQTPIVLAGDFNGNASRNGTDSEFSAIYQHTALKDVGEIMGLESEKTATYYQVNRNGKSEPRQLDYCFLSPAAVKCLKSKSTVFYRYRDELGLEHNPPTSLEEKSQHPSDHYPIFFEMELNSKV